MTQVNSTAGSFNKFLLDGTVEGLGIDLFAKPESGCAQLPLITILTWKNEGSTLNRMSAHVKVWLELMPTFVMQLYGTLNTLDLFCFARGEQVDESREMHQLKHCIEALQATK